MPPGAGPDDTNEFQRILAVATERCGGARAAAEAIGVTESRYSKVVNARGEYKTFGPVNCLRLAKVAGANPSVVLRSAGHQTVADLIEEVYGLTRTGTPTPALTSDQTAALAVGTRLLTLKDAGLRTQIVRLLEIGERLVDAARESSTKSPTDNPGVTPGTSHGTRRRARS